MICLSESFQRSLIVSHALCMAEHIFIESDSLTIPSSVVDDAVKSQTVFILLTQLFSGKQMQTMTAAFRLKSSDPSSTETSSRAIINTPSGRFTYSFFEFPK